MRKILSLNEVYDFFQDVKDLSSNTPGGTLIVDPGSENFQAL